MMTYVTNIKSLRMSVVEGSRLILTRNHNAELVHEFLPSCVALSQCFSVWIPWKPVVPVISVTGSAQL